MSDPTHPSEASARPRPWRWGFVATGGIAAAVAGDLALTPGAVAHAVASSSGLARAQAFADEHGFARAYGSYAELIADPDVDVVYVATPHAQHAEVAAAAIEAGTPVLVEKAMTSGLAATRELVDLARARGVFLMEALWTRFQPLVVTLREQVSAQVIGDVRWVATDLGFPALGADDAGGPGAAHPTTRFWDPALGGGALLDLGVYVVNLAQMLLGDPRSVHAAGSLAATGVDAEASLLMQHDGGRQSLASVSLLATQPGGARIVGTDGWIELVGPAHRPRRLVVHRSSVHDHRDADAGDEVARHEAPQQSGRGYTDQLAHVQQCLGNALTESPVMPLEDSVTLADTLEQALVALGATRSAEVGR